MIRFFVGTIVIIVLVAGAWYYTPVSIKEKVLGFVGLAAPRGEIKNLGEDVILPADPEERREVLVRELKKNVGELKRRAAKSGTVDAGMSISVRDTASPVIAKADTKEVIGAAEKLLDELEKSSGDKSAGDKILERIIERILPPPQCRE